MPTLYKATGEEQPIEPKNKIVFTLEELQSYVKGYFEIVALPHGERMIVNEDAIRLEMPYNSKASELAGGDILGDVLVCDGSFLE